MKTNLRNQYMGLAKRARAKIRTQGRSGVGSLPGLGVSGPARSGRGLAHGRLGKESRRSSSPSEAAGATGGVPSHTCRFCVAGSAYCDRRYIVYEHIGGPKGLAAARKEPARRGIRLILDFVSNHTAQDHPWISDHPEYYIQGGVNDLANAPAAFFKADGKVIACGLCAWSEAFPRRPDREPENTCPCFSWAPSAGGAENTPSGLL